MNNHACGNDCATDPSGAKWHHEGARERLNDLVTTLTASPHYDAEPAVNLELDAYAHELADKVRALRDTYYGTPEFKAIFSALNRAADLIDPYVQEDR